MPLQSMTGFGDARSERDAHAISVEVRAINSRHLKLNVRITEGYSSLEARLESVMREFVRRGTIHLNLRVRYMNAGDDYRINEELLDNYLDSLQKVAARRNLPEELRLERLAQLPGVVEEKAPGARNADAVWPLVEPTLREALESLTQMRRNEGEALQRDLADQCRSVSANLAAIAQRSPAVVEGYRQRLQDRVGETLAEFQVTIDSADLIREVSIFAERSDISEEIVRLQSHLRQFDTAMQLPDSAGRKLEFICQEMGRETNTIGAKANDSEISARVVEIKTALERIREQIQNVE